jgi:glycosyltransferase involved in cell wall biosynthesis
MLKISIVTPTHNSVKTISRTIESIISQNYSNIEYIVIDGDSIDGTQDLILKYKDQINLKLVSEKDNGIYDAMNKGIKIATGDIIGILNSDDFYANNNIFNSILKEFEDSNVDIIYGDISYFGNDTNKITRFWKVGEYKEGNLNNGWVIPHPALFLRKSVYDKCGYFNIDLKIAADYEFILRILKVYKINIKYIPKTFVRMYNGGKSGKNFKQRIKGWVELRKSWAVNNLKIPKFFIFRRILYKMSQYFFFRNS